MKTLTRGCKINSCAVFSFCIDYAPIQLTKRPKNIFKLTLRIHRCNFSLSDESLAVTTREIRNIEFVNQVVCFLSNQDKISEIWSQVILNENILNAKLSIITVRFINFNW